MSPASSTALISIADLMRLDPLAQAETVHLADPWRQVREVVLAETFARLHQTMPHALLVLHAEAAMGGWSLASALHIAWERNAAAVVVARQPMSSSSAVLAERLGITLLAIDRDPIDVALSLASQVSAPQAARALRMAQCAQRLAEQSSIRGVLGVLNNELAPATVALTIGGSFAGGRAAALEERAESTPIRVEIHGPGGRSWATLVASTLSPTAETASQVEPLLLLARPSLLAAWMQTRINSSTQVAQERAAFHLLRKLANELGERPDGGSYDARTPLECIDSQPWNSELGWRIDGLNRAVWITSLNATDAEPTPELTQLMRAAWQRHVPDWALVTDDDGWISWQNGDDPDTVAPMRSAVGSAVGTAYEHSLVFGVGGAHRGVAGLIRSLAEAQLASHVAREGGPGTVTWFDQVGARATLAWLPAGQIAQVADLSLPELIAARDREALVETVLTVLDCGGSLSRASVCLGVHRNTVLSRVARARELNLVFDDPSQRLAIHVLCYALNSRWKAAEPTQ